MIGHKAVVGLSLLCALLLSAIAVQSASAAAGTNTTAFTCVETVMSGQPFTDAHCDKEGSGKFVHGVIAVKTSTNISASNVTTGAATSPMGFAGKPFGVTTNISCTKLSTTEGKLENSEPAAGVHKITGSITFDFDSCTATAPAKCTVKGPIQLKVGSIESQEGLTGPKGEANAMGLEFKSVAGKPLAEVTLEGAECALKGKPFPIEGSFITTGGPGEAESQNKKFSGATEVLNTSESMSKTTAGGKAATLSAGCITIIMEGGSPITKTTAT